jgi:hypothetical protein
MSADEPSDDPDDVGTYGLDPYIDWALGPGRPCYFIPGRTTQWIPVLLHVNGIGVQEFAAGTPFIDDDEERRRWAQSVRVSPLYMDSPAAADAYPFFTAMVREDFFEFTKSNSKLRAMIGGITLSLPLDSEALPPDMSSDGLERGHP